MKRLIAIFFLISLAFWQCKQDAPQPITVPDVLLERDDLSTFRAALKYTGLTDALKTGTFTILAPSNDAFKAAGILDITTQSQEAVKLLLRNHILNKSLPTELMKNGRNNTDTTMASNRIFLSNINNKFYINEASFTQTNLGSANGTVHIINKVIPTVTKTIADHLQQNTAYKLFYQALVRASTSDIRLKKLMDTAAPWHESFTVFVPSNNAMTLAGYDSVSISKLSPRILAIVVDYHVALGRTFSNELSEKQFLTMLDASNSIKIDYKNNIFTLTGGVPNETSTIRKADIYATNGVIYEIDKVLIPK